MLALLVCPVVGLITLLLAVRGMAPKERKLIVVAMGLHIVGTIGVVLYHQEVFRGGDMRMYGTFGRQIARLLRVSFSGHVVDVAKLIAQVDNDLPVEVLLEGSTTATMIGVTGLLMYVTDDSVFGACFLISFFSFWGTFGIYRAAREHLAPREREAALAGTMFIPSVLFWTSGIVKEALLVGFLGLLVRGLADVLLRRRIVAVIGLGIGLYGVALIKPYTLFPLILAFGGWFYARRGRGVSLVYKVLSVVVAVGGIVVLTRLFPSFGVDNLAQNAARTRQNYELVGTMGSGVSLGEEAEDFENASLSGQLKFVPIGLVNSIARPFFFEARNATMAVATVEMTALTVLILLTIRRHGARPFFAPFSRRPPLSFALVFVLMFGAGVGIATANLGSLSRYRVPMMPFYVASVLVVRAQLAAAGAGAQRRAPSRPQAVAAARDRLLASARRRRAPGPIQSR